VRTKHATVDLLLDRHLDLDPDLDLEGHMNAALYKSKDGDGLGCLAELDRADQLDSRHAPMRWMTRATCEMQAGKCADGRARFRAGLDNSPTPRHLSTEELDNATAWFAAMNCPRKTLLPRERILADMKALHDANQRGDADFCAREGMALVPIVMAIPQSDGGTDTARASGISDLNTAMECAGKGGKCDEARAMHEAFFKLVQTKLTDAQLAASFASRFPQCKTP
jgi:hypothetical protein